MTEHPSRAIRLFGTDEPVAAPQLLRAGLLTAELEAGNLRYIRYSGIEMIRAILFIVRDRNWGTYNPQILGLVVEQGDESFTVAYDAVARDASQELRYSAKITGRADGSLRFEGKARAVTDFVTNRAGFVVLHPVPGAVGAAATIEEVDGTIRETRFPDLIDPVQPMLNLRSITHAFAPGARVICRMEGDTFEMEDQRNWSDASFKTYVRPLALPWPYTLSAGTEIEQAVSLALNGRPVSAAAATGVVTLQLGEEFGKAPPVGVGLEPEDLVGVRDRLDALRELAPAHVVCHHDPRRGHDVNTLRAAVEAVRGLGANPWLEAVVTKVEGFEAEIAALGDQIAALGSPFETVMLSPAADLKSTLPGTQWPPCPPLAELYAAARRAFPHSRLGGGMFSYFTELNRKRPPADKLDFVSFTTSALVHAGDDRSVTESLEALPFIARSVGAFIGDKPYAVGPSAVGMRHNPYGAAPMDNPRDIRQAMNRNDPRQRGLLGAAWNLGYFTHLANAGASAVTLGGLVGAFGLLHVPTAWPQAFFDEAGGLYPSFHVLRGLARLSGKPLLRIASSAAREVQALAVRDSSGIEMWIANLTGERQRVVLEGGPINARVAILDSATFPAAARDPRLLDRAEAPVPSSIDLDAYAVARLVTD